VEDQQKSNEDEDSKNDINVNRGNPITDLDRIRVIKE